jgi:hypothetical protein
LGNLNGIRAEVRDQINTAVMNEDLNRADDSVRYRNAVQVKQGLDHDRGSDPGNQRPVLLWVYDPLAFNGEGSAAIAIGDPDHAEDIAVIVPGAGNSVASGWLADGHNDAINVYDQSMAAYPGDDLSVIAWMGYEELVAMQRPDVRSTNRDKPTHPSMPPSAGITVSRMCAIPASMDEGCAGMVVLRAYMICLRCMWRSVSTAPPDNFIVRPQPRHGNGWRVSA